MKALLVALMASAIAVAPGFAAERGGHPGGGAPAVHAAPAPRAAAPRVVAPRAMPRVSAPRAGPVRVERRGTPLGPGERIVTPHSRAYGGHVQRTGHGRGMYPGYGPDYYGPCWILLPVVGWVDVCDPLD